MLGGLCILNHLIFTAASWNADYPYFFSEEVEAHLGKNDMTVCNYYKDSPDVAKTFLVEILRYYDRTRAFKFGISYGW